MAIPSKSAASAEANEGKNLSGVEDEDSGTTQQGLPSEPNLPAEFDHRGVRMPARTRVGGIIIPQ